MKTIKKLFGGLEMSWKRLILFAVIAGVYTGIAAMFPFFKDTSFADIAATFEWWIFFALIIITNCKKPLETVCKTFIFFLISQPLVYLVQVPFSWLGWGIFRYYPPWFVWTLMTIPMSFIGWFINKKKWYSLLILSPLLLLLAYTGSGYFRDTIYDMPRHLFTVIFCFVQMFVLVLCIFEAKSLRITGSIMNTAFIGILLFFMMKDLCYVDSTSSYAELDPTHTYSIEADDPSIADVEVIQDPEDVTIHTRVLKKGDTSMTLTDETTGETKVYTIHCGDNRDLTISEDAQ